jgi:hypothetical protein
MRVLGNGFLARNLRHLAPARSDIVLLAADVSSSLNFTRYNVRREDELVRAVSTRCAATGALLVYFSSIGPLGPDDGGMRVESEEVRPSLAYGRHKAGMEQLVRDGKAHHLILRMATSSTGARIPGSWSRRCPSKSCQVGCASRSGRCATFSTSGDAVDLVGTLLRNGVRDAVVNVASGMSVTVDDVVDHLSFLLGRTPTVCGVEAGGGYSADITLLNSFGRNRWAAVSDLLHHFRIVPDRYFALSARG